MDERELRVVESVYKNELGPLCWPTQLTKEKGNLIITDYRNNRFLIKKGRKWQQSSIKVSGPHSIVTHKENYIINSTESNEIIITKKTG